ncbi:MAG: PASTA domain-containing protein [Clostridia bacterium]|nr:PASTA domain-containing protein [Clostridia bacterium]
MQNAIKKVSLKRIRVLMLVIFLGFAILGVKLMWVQLVKGNYYKEKALQNQLSDTVVEAQRGTIYDSNMNVLVQSATVWKVFIDPVSIKSESEKYNKDVAEELAQNLSKILGVKKQEVLTACKKETRYEVIKDDVEHEMKQKLLAYTTENKYTSCVGVETSTKRYYSSSSFAATVLGFVGSDGQGIEGLESFYDDTLTGTAGRIVTAKNAQAGSMPNNYESVIDSTDGSSIVLTIDDVLQYSLEKNLDTARTNADAKYAYGVVMDVNTGAILAMSNKPDFDSDDPWEIKDKKVKKEISGMKDKKERAQAESDALIAQWRNRTISDTYEPGSVFKIVTAAAGLEEGVVKPEDTYYDSGSIEVEDRVYHCQLRTGHGLETFSEGLQNSCNPWFITVGQKLGVHAFYKYFEAFGFTEKTNIDLPGEAIPAAGVTYHREEEMGKVELASESFGQSFQVSPIQMITAVCAAANGGKLMQPYVVKEVLDKEGTVTSTTQPKVKRQVISEATSKTLSLMLEEVVKYGTGKNAYVAGYRVAGKTGTSEKLGTIGDDTGKKYVTSFVAFAPANDPKVAVLIAVDEPQGGNIGGGTNAAPSVAAVLEEAMKYYNVQPQYTEDEMSQLETATPSVVGMSVEKAQSLLADKELQYIVVGKGKEVTGQSPAADRNIPGGGTVVLYTDKDYKAQTVKVPDFTGLSVSEANQLAADNSLNIRFSGNNLESGSVTAYRQSSEKDSEVEKGSVITVFFIASSGVSDTYTGSTEQTDTQDYSQDYTADNEQAYAEE